MLLYLSNLVSSIAAMEGAFMGKKLIGIRAVLFDIDDTLFPSSEFASLARKNAQRAMIAAGMDATEEQAQQEHFRIIKKYGSNYGRQLDLLASRFPCKKRLRAIAAGIAAYHDAKASIHPFPHAQSTLMHLQKKGYALCIASEGKAIKQWDKLVRLGLDLFFSHVFITRKKSPSFYRACAHRLRLSPSQCLMVGNHPKKDFSFSKKAGMHSLLLSRSSARKKQAQIRSLDSLQALLC